MTTPTSPTRSDPVPGTDLVICRPPTPGEVGRRLVRHGMADILAWLGEPLGPAPDDPVIQLWMPPPLWKDDLGTFRAHMNAALAVALAEPIDHGLFMGLAPGT